MRMCFCTSSAGISIYIQYLYEVYYTISVLFDPLQWKRPEQSINSYHISWELCWLFSQQNNFIYLSCCENVVCLIKHKPRLIFISLFVLNRRPIRWLLYYFYVILLCNLLHSKQVTIKIRSNEIYLKECTGHLRAITWHKQEG